MQPYAAEEEKPFFFSPAGDLPPLEINPTEKSIQSKKQPLNVALKSPLGERNAFQKNHHFGPSECPEPDSTSSQGKQILPQHHLQPQTGASPACSFHPIRKYHKVVQVKANLVVGEGTIKSSKNHQETSSVCTVA